MTKKTDSEWRAQLTPEQYSVLREHGTEPPFTGKYVDCHDDGTYHCAGCGRPLFSSADKFESGSGWPSFTDMVKSGSVETKTDRSWLVVRTEIVCAGCGGHLGHVFEDGPAPTGLRYCVNSAALDLQSDHLAE